LHFFTQVYGCLLGIEQFERKMRMTKKITILALLGVIILTIFKIGRSTYIPVVKKIKGKATLASIKEDLEPTVKKRLYPYLAKQGFDAYPEKLSILAFKEAQKLEVYGWKDNQPQLIKSYDFTAFSGQLGPKLKEGDRQIPEGIYKMEYLNPNSSYHLSIKVSYPNEFDRAKGRLDGRKQLGGDIFIHGKAVTIGCIPIGDVAIEEVFVLSMAAKKGIDIIISPRDFRKNAQFPIIEGITWEEELYGQIQQALARY